MLSNTPAAPIADQMMKTATQVTIPKAIDSRNAVFITDHGSIRDIRSRAFRVCGRVEVLAPFSAMRPCMAPARSPGPLFSGFPPVTPLPFPMTACRAASLRSPSDPVLASDDEVTPYDDALKAVAPADPAATAPAAPTTPAPEAPGDQGS